MKSNPNENKIHEEFADIWDLAKDYTPKEAQDNDASWQKFQHKIQASEKTAKPAPILSVVYRRILSYAAVIALLIFSGYMFLQPEKMSPIAQVTENTTSGQAREIQLPDGSTVMLGANSELNYRFSESKREIELIGHARFEVARNENAPFTVNTSSTKVTVLGTGFDVDAYPNSDVKIYVNHGKVKVENDQQEAILIKNQGVISKNSEIIAWNAAENPLQVHNDYMKFNNASLDFVLETLKHTQNMHFNSVKTDLTNTRFTGTLKFNQNAEVVAQLLNAALQINLVPQTKM